MCAETLPPSWSLEYLFKYSKRRDSQNTPVNGNVKPHELDKASVVTEAEQCGEIVGVILLCVNRRELASAIDIAVYAARNIRQLCDASVHMC